MKLSKILKTSTITGGMALAAIGCGERKVEIRTIQKEGLVIQEFGNLPSLAESRGAFFGNESVKIGEESYGIVVSVNDTLYTISLYDDRRRPFEAMEVAISPNKTRVRFYTRTDGQERFSTDRIGSLYTGAVELLN